MEPHLPSPSSPSSNGWAKQVRMPQHLLGPLVLGPGKTKRFLRKVCCYMDLSGDPPRKITPWNLTNCYPKWRHVWSRRYIFKPPCLVSMLVFEGVNWQSYANSSPTWEPHPNWALLSRWFSELPVLVGPMWSFPEGLPEGNMVPCVSFDAASRWGSKARWNSSRETPPSPFLSWRS